jgi:hypothetical protein
MKTKDIDETEQTPLEEENVIIEEDEYIGDLDWDEDVGYIDNDDD